MPPIWVLSANLAGQERKDWAVRANLAARIFGDCPCSLAGFQEFGREIDSWDALGPAHLDLKIYKGIPLDDIYIQPIAYDGQRFEVLERDTFWLSSNGEPVPASGTEYVRGTSFVLLRDRSVNKVFLFMNSHLDNISTQAREEGIRLNLEKIKDVCSVDIPVIYTADSNISVNSPLERWKDKRSWSDSEMRRPYDMMLGAGFEDTSVVPYRTDVNPEPERPCTYHGFQGQQRYQDKGGDGFGTWDPDVILTRGFKIINSTVVTDGAGGIFPSDHYWIMSLLDYM
ncbi:MAG: hypothetical protein KW793_04700 [Candidatus Doudnabacteria bacterium]|nr:hypothetical protein [Candidatus Doudnabacteria bacterium]